MGREAEARVSWKGAAGQSRVLLEAAGITLRGEVRGQIARSAVTGIATAGGDLVLRTDEGPLVLALGARTAAVWAEALRKPPPSLAAKLGVGPDARVFVLGAADDPALAEALTGAVVGTPGEAALLLAVIGDDAALAEALALAEAHPALPLWCVYPKGKAAGPGDAGIRRAMRAAGLIDTKSSAVSDRLTATRYGRAKR